jgi:hypothetical protein
MEKYQNQDVRLNDYLRMLIKDFKIFFYFIFIGIIIALVMSYFLNNYDIDTKYKIESKIKPYSFNKLVYEYQKFLIGGEIVTFLDDESLLEIKTFYTNPMIPNTDKSRTMTYNLFIMYSDIIRNSRILSKAKSNLIKNKKINNIEAKSINMSFNQTFSDALKDTSKGYKDFIEIGIISPNEEISKIVILELLDVAFTELVSQILIEIQMLNGPKINLINFMIDSLKNDLKIYQQNFGSKSNSDKDGWIFMNDKFTPWKDATSNIKIIESKIERLLFISNKFNSINTIDKSILELDYDESDFVFNLEVEDINIPLLNLIIYSLFISFLLFILFVYLKAILTKKDIII